MDGTSTTTTTVKKGTPSNMKEFLDTIRVFPKTAWNAWPSRHYVGMVTVEQTKGGWMVHVAPIGCGEKVNSTFYSHEDEEALYFDVGRKMHPSLICTCASPNSCFEGSCKVRPAG